MRVGRAVEGSGIPRGEIFLTSKVWVEHYGYEECKKSVGISMEKLKTDYIDLMLLHQPFGDYYGAWRALEELYEAGRLRAIGFPISTPTAWWTWRPSRVCAVKDNMAEVLQKIIDADVIILASHVYFYSVDARLKALIDRTVARWTEVKDKEFYYIMTAADG